MGLFASHVVFLLMCILYLQTPQRDKGVRAALPPRFAELKNEVGGRGRPPSALWKLWKGCSFCRTRFDIGLDEEEGTGRLKPRPPYGKQTTSVQIVSAWQEDDPVRTAADTDTGSPEAAFALMASFFPQYAVLFRSLWLIGILLLMAKKYRSLRNRRKTGKKKH